MTFNEGESATLPIGARIMHSASYEDARGDYLELWLLIPEEAVVMSKSINILGEETPTPAASDPDDRMSQDTTLEEPDIDDEEPAFQL
jgi:hypothetical protein